MRSLPILSLLLLMLLVAVAAPAQTTPPSNAVPVQTDGSYLVSRALLTDYAVCTAEADLYQAAALRLPAIEQATRDLARSRAAEVAALKQAGVACSARVRLLTGRYDVIAAERDLAARTAATALRSRDRWKTAALGSGGAAVVLTTLTLLRR